MLVSRGSSSRSAAASRSRRSSRRPARALAEVGTTNRTSIEDYRRALSQGAALLLTVHPSNYEIRGYTRRPAAAELAALAREAGIPWVHDQGTGCVEPLEEFGVTGEPTVASCLADGADIVTFSGDKLFGGPQAGFVVGRSDLVSAVAAHPVARVVRLDKMALAALSEYARRPGRRGRWRELPIYRAAGAPLAELEERGRKIREAVGKRASAVRLEVVESTALFGGGTSPEKPFPSRALSVSLAPFSPDDLAGRLRRLTPPVVARIEGERLLLDLRSIQPEEDSAIEEALAGVEGESAAR